MLAKPWPAGFPTDWDKDRVAVGVKPFDKMLAGVGGPFGRGHPSCGRAAGPLAGGGWRLTNQNTLMASNHSEAKNDRKLFRIENFGIFVSPDEAKIAQRSVLHFKVSSVHTTFGFENLGIRHHSTSSQSCNSYLSS